MCTYRLMLMTIMLDKDARHVMEQIVATTVHSVRRCSNHHSPLITPINVFSVIARSKKEDFIVFMKWLIDQFFLKFRDQNVSLNSLVKTFDIQIRPYSH